MAGRSAVSEVMDGAGPVSELAAELKALEVAMADPAVARALGVAMVYQHFSLFESLTVSENIALGLDQRMSRPQLIEAIEKAANTGKIGDGKVFVTALAQVIRIRTGETGEDAI